MSWDIRHTCANNAHVAVLQQDNYGTVWDWIWMTRMQLEPARIEDLLQDCEDGFRCETWRRRSHFNGQVIIVKEHFWVPVRLGSH